MKRTLIDGLPQELPEEILAFSLGARVYDSSCSREARVYYIERGGGYYLKTSARGTLSGEALMNAYFHKKGIGPEVLHYTSGEVGDILLTARVAGEDCTHESFLSMPERLCDRIATELRRLHELDFSDCPVKDRTGAYIDTVRNNYESGSYDTSHFPDSFGYRSAEEAIGVFREGERLLRRDTLIHGDYCLPNIMLNEDFSLSGFIDLGFGGVGDRHIDLFWGAWTLAFNLGTDKYRSRFFDAYGRDGFDMDMIKVIAAAEVFG